jgi:sec-independent protein translocase protein TatA
LQEDSMPLRNIGPTELIIVLAILLLLFGVGRVSKVGRELGTAISEFRRGIKDEDEESAEEPADA